jgi:hypothetical protein
MEATYSLEQLQSMITDLDGDETELLRSLINEERALYSFSELIEIYKLIMEHILELWKKEQEDLPGKV